MKATHKNFRKATLLWVAIIFHFSFFAFHFNEVSAQNQIANLMSFDNNLLHFGIQVGFTDSKFDLGFSEDDELRRKIQGTTSYFKPGFHIAIIGDMRLNRFFNLRLLPGVTFITRGLEYSWEPNALAANLKAETWRTVESVYGDIPIEIKFRAIRYGNFRPYLVTGLSYGFDFASLRKNRNSTQESIVKLSASDFRYTAGVGFDVFLFYVKFAIELKMAFGLMDLHVPDNDVYAQSVNGLYSRTFMLSFTFEGGREK